MRIRTVSVKYPSRPGKTFNILIDFPLRIYLRQKKPLKADQIISLRPIFYLDLVSVFLNKITKRKFSENNGYYLASYTAFLYHLL